MTLTFNDTHNMTAYLTKSDTSEGFNQIIDFLNVSSIKYALTVNPNIYVSCIKQFWTSVAVKKVNDVTMLQALVDKKKMVVTEATIRDALRLDDAGGIKYLPDEEIFAELARMGYEKPSTKLTFYKAFFSSQWKFLIHTILQCMSAKRTSWNEFSSSMASAVICLSKGKGFYGVDTPLFEGMIVAQGVGEGDVDEVNAADARISMDLLQNLLDTCTTLTRRVEYLEQDKIAQALEITKLKQRVKKLERRNKLKGGIIANIDADEDVVLEDAKDIAVEKSADMLSMQDDEELEPSELQKVVDVVTTAKIITEVVIAASDTITATSTTITVAAPQLTTTAAPQLTTAAAHTLTTAPTARRGKGVAIRDPKETATISTIIHSKAKSKDKGKGILRKQKDDNAVKRYQDLKRKPQTEAQARKNMMIYLRNVVGFKMDYFKGISYDDIHLIFEKKFNSNVAFLQKTKEQMDEEDSRALKRLNENDVYTEATPLALKVPIVDYKIYNKHNKPYYKIKRADGSHQLYLSFLSMLWNFDREDLEALWRSVKERFATTKPKHFSDDFLLTTLGAMFEKPDIQAQIWKNQRSVHERRYPLIRFTLDQMVNNVQLEVKEESEVSLEMLSFGVDAAEDFKEKHAK
uniref:Xylulose kinase-1 n=1 Tax=Tanacetum cinerariifolium TaxID=118510 RepID=A0A6L2K5Y9_TANCI|nr:hypothetical protein [Tanacetum cinerariifolium]